MRYAVHSKSGKLVLAGLADQNSNYKCPLCRWQVHLRGGKLKSSYFAHARTPSHARRRCHANDRDILDSIVELFDIEM